MPPTCGYPLLDSLRQYASASPGLPISLMAFASALLLTACASLQVYMERKEHSKPPVSLLGQLLWREFYYTAAAHTPNYHQKEGNPICKQIPWDDNLEYFKVGLWGLHAVLAARLHKSHI